MRGYGENVVVRPAKPAEKTGGGLFIPPSAQRTPREGVLVAIGPRAVEKLDGAKVGDRVIIGSYAADRRKYTVDGEEHVVCPVDDVLAVVEGDCGLVEGRRPGSFDSRGKHIPGSY